MVGRMVLQAFPVRLIDKVYINRCKGIMWLRIYVLWIKVASEG